MGGFGRKLGSGPEREVAGVNSFKVATLISAALLAACGTAGPTAGVVYRGQAFDLDTVATGREWIVSMAGAQPEG